MTTLCDRQEQHSRLLILKLLHSRPGYEANANLLSSLLGDVGQAMSHDALAMQLAWLQEQRLIAIRTLMGTMQVASLTSRGQDVALGRAVVPGVRRPDPGEPI